MTEKLLLSVTDAAKLLGVDQRAVKAAIDAGKLRTVVLIRRRLIPRSSIDAFLSGGAEKP